MAVLKSQHRRWIEPPYPSFDPNAGYYYMPRRGRVGASPEELAAQGVAKADVYTYGAASSALSEGQAMAAWAELQKQQNYPQVKAIAAKYQCPSGFLFSPDGETCVNRDNVHVAMGNSCAGDSWWNCSALVNYIRLNEPSLLESSVTLPQVADGVLRGLRAMRMTTGSFGWTNVKSELRAVAWMLGAYQLAGVGTGEVDETAFKLEKTIGPLYDKDQANGPATEAKSKQIIADLIKSQHLAAGSKAAGRGGLALAAVGIAALAIWQPALALGAIAGIWSGAKRATSYVAGKAKGAVT